ncbi:3-keto-5-aminohexanoate cleavage protein [Planomonospora corallina]|uniref:3-keto-5-aminohexanoate cleavage protein n=1 Tax=Planomonospora corallina TaxID=1806052 RepID=A0ABV8IG92_9ACTN
MTGGAQSGGGDGTAGGFALQACLNGSRGPTDHPGLPVTPLRLAQDACAARAAGAGAVHMHPRDGTGRESLSAADIGAAVREVRRAAPGLPTGVSTGLWTTAGDVAARRAAVLGWAALPTGDRPDFASVNLSEPGFTDLCEDLRRLGVGVEAGVWSVADAEALAAAGTDCVRVLVEVIGGEERTAVARAHAVLARLDELAVPGPRLLHGEHASAWVLVDEAGRLGLATRIGLEDVLHGPAGEPVRGNADLVRLARTRLATYGR